MLRSIYLCILLSVVVNAKKGKTCPREFNKICKGARKQRIVDVTSPVYNADKPKKALKKSRHNPLSDHLDLSQLSSEAKVTYEAEAENDVKICEGTDYENEVDLPAVSWESKAPYNRVVSTDETRGLKSIEFECEKGEYYSFLLFDFSFSNYHGSELNVKCPGDKSETPGVLKIKPNTLAPGNPYSTKGTYLYGVFKHKVTESDRDNFNLELGANIDWLELNSLLGIVASTDGALPAPVAIAWANVVGGYHSANFLKVFIGTDFEPLYDIACGVAWDKSEKNAKKGKK